MNNFVLALIKFSSKMYIGLCAKTETIGFVRENIRVSKDRGGGSKY